MGNPKWTADPRFASLTNRKENEAELDERLSEWTKSFTPEHIMEKLQERGVPAGVLKTGADIQDDRQLNYRKHYIQLEHPEMGKRYYEAAAGFVLSETPANICRPSPLLGQHTGYVCRKILGMSDEEFDDLSNQGIFE
jgi:benzylsuccinate CoA-transferase BbsF subunit